MTCRTSQTLGFAAKLLPLLWPARWGNHRCHRDCQIHDCNLGMKKLVPDMHGAGDWPLVPVVELWWHCQHVFKTWHGNVAQKILIIYVHLCECIFKVKGWVPGSKGMYTLIDVAELLSKVFYGFTLPPTFYLTFMNREKPRHNFKTSTNLVR